MAFSAVYGAYNVEGSLNDYFRVQLTAAGVPAWMPSARVVFDYPRTPLFSGYSGHAFSVTHLGSPEPIQQFQGRHTVGGSAGQMVGNLMEINCWINRQQAGENYEARLRQMEDMVHRVFLSTVSVEIKNLYTGAQAPSGIGALVRVSPVQGQSVAPDENADVLRRRLLVRYWWIERV